MALIEMRISETGEVYEYSKVENSIRWLKSFEPPEGYFLAFSGGKDSCVLKALADMAGVKYDAHYAVTSVDPPPSWCGLSRSITRMCQWIFRVKTRMIRTARRLRCGI